MKDYKFIQAVQRNINKNYSVLALISLKARGEEKSTYNIELVLRDYDSELNDNIESFEIECNYKEVGSVVNEKIKTLVSTGYFDKPIKRIEEVNRYCSIGIEYELRFGKEKADEITR